MKRSAMLYCADLEASRYKVLKQRKQLPYVGDDDEEDDPGGWADFTLNDAFRIRLALDLIGNDGLGKSEEDRLKGLPPGYAAKVVFNAMSSTDLHPLKMPADTDFWLAVVIFESLSKEDGAYRFSSWYAGPLTAFSDWIDDEVAKAEKDGWIHVPVRTCMVNAVRAATFVRQRALELGLQEVAEYTEVPE